MNDLIEKFGSKFPNCINDKIVLSESKKKEIDSFIDKYPFLKTRTTYIDFLLTYSGLSYLDDKTDEDFTLYGFNSSGIAFSDSDYFSEPLLDPKGYFLIGHLYQPSREKFYDFVFNATKAGVYVKESIAEKSFDFRLLCETFEAFLAKIALQEVK